MDEETYGTLPMGSVVVISEKPMRKKKKTFPFGFQAPVEPTPAKPKGRDD